VLIALKQKLRIWLFRPRIEHGTITLIPLRWRTRASSSGGKDTFIDIIILPKEYER